MVHWGSEAQRLKQEAAAGVVDLQVLLESENQRGAISAARGAAHATTEKATAELLSDQAGLTKAKVDVKVALADLGGAQSEEKRRHTP